MPLILPKIKWAIIVEVMSASMVVMTFNYFIFSVDTWTLMPTLFIAFEQHCIFCVQETITPRLDSEKSQRS